MSALRQYNEAAAILAAEIAEDDALILAEDAIQAEPEGPLFWDDYAEHSTHYVRNGSMG